MWVDLAGTANTRDLGGLPTVDGGSTRNGALLRSDNLQDLTAADIAELTARGLSAVLDLRTSTERELIGPGPLAGQVQHVELSFIPEERLPEPGEIVVDRWAAGAAGAYLRYLQDAPDAFAAAAAVVARSEGAVLVHCAAGKDRTGTLVALLLDAVGVERAAIVDDYALTNDRIERVYARLLGEKAYGEFVEAIGLDAHRVDAAAMHAVLEALDERWGGSAAYFRQAGFDDVAGLRRRLLA